MNIHAFQKLLAEHPAAELAFTLPDGGMVAPHAHITEIGRVEKTFLDCGGTLRKTATCSLQIWEADDTEHRFSAGKLAGVFKKAQAILGNDDLPLEIEYQEQSLSQYTVLNGEFSDGALRLNLGIKNTDCLAKNVCLPQEDESSCCGGSGCG